MPGRLREVLRRVRALAVAGSVRFTHKALCELAELDLGLDETDACRILAGLTTGDAVGRAASDLTGEWLHVSKPRVGGTVLYVKLVLRADCVVVSFHQEVEDDEENGGGQG
ncbi:MAG: type II toxin-antitoxin system MqsR family toxin [Deltaproteobacteria bacterium]|nr:type II toxin-antitoxin system MqsR family toxin [Deltaproteobacteria bacterium]